MDQPFKTRHSYISQYYQSPKQQEDKKNNNFQFEHFI